LFEVLRARRGTDTHRFFSQLHPEAGNMDTLPGFSQP
jgi:hypothetical protein